jgi:hypothetical protein
MPAYQITCYEIPEDSCCDLQCHEHPGSFVFLVVFCTSFSTFISISLESEIHINSVNWALDGDVCVSKSCVTFQIPDDVQ